MGLPFLILLAFSSMKTKLARKLARQSLPAVWQGEESPDFTEQGAR